MEILLYKLKDIENIKDFLKICNSLNLSLSIIKREGADYDFIKDKKVQFYDSFEEFLEKNKDKKFLFFETYGDKYIFDVNLKDFDIFVFGAEDYGIPIEIIEKVKNKEIVKIPTKIPGSYNVVSSFIVFLTFYLS
ncbi:MAG: TrmH family RNA methyltransferase [Nanopusillaceae archaeon]